MLEIFWDWTANAIVHKSVHLRGHEKQMILNIIQQIEDMHAAEGQNTAI